MSLSLWASLRPLTTMNINVVKLSLNWKRFSWFRTCGRTNCLGSLVRSGPEHQYFFFVFLHSPESRHQDTGFVFALRSAAHRGSRSRSPLYISASPTSLLSCLKHCKIQPVIDQLLILKPGCWPTKKWWNLRGDPTSCYPLICRLCAICSKQRFGRSVSVFFWEVIKSFLTVTHHWHCWNTQAIPTHTGPCARQDPLLFFLTTNPALSFHFCGC